MAGPDPAITRRGTIVAAAGLPVLAACGGGGTSGAEDPATAGSSGTPASQSPPSQSPPSEPPPTEPTTSSPPAAEPGLVPAADVPVGGGVVVADQNVVVTQPSDGRFLGFTAICTHMGCTVASVSETINCDCHGSRYSITDGSVVNGPAQRALAEKPVRVVGGQVRLA
jgi:Rieske Fe-S protein